MFPKKTAFTRTKEGGQFKIITMLTHLVLCLPLIQVTELRIVRSH